MGIKKNDEYEKTFTISAVQEIRTLSNPWISGQLEKVGKKDGVGGTSKKYYTTMYSRRVHIPKH